MTTTPHCCPICQGRGEVPPGFYIGSVFTRAISETCRTCQGTGVLWESLDVMTGVHETWKEWVDPSRP